MKSDSSELRYHLYWYRGQDHYNSEQRCSETEGEQKHMIFAPCINNGDYGINVILGISGKVKAPLTFEIGGKLYRRTVRN
jgi:hypothetical protein